MRSAQLERQREPAFDAYEAISTAASSAARGSPACREIVASGLAWSAAAIEVSRQFRGSLVRSLTEAGVELRVFNPPSLGSPFGWISRDHRKLIVVDGQVGFVSGLCVSQKWLGDPLRNLAPWRDTGVELRGPAAASRLSSGSVIAC